MHIYFIILLTSFFSCINSNNDFSSKIQQLSNLVSQLKNDEILDGEVLIADSEKIIVHERSNEVQKEAVSGKQPQFMIASNSKQFTAVALLKTLYEQSASKDEKEKCVDVIAQLHKPIIEFLPKDQFDWGKEIPKWAHEITLHHLLSHTSGIFQPIRLMFQEKGYEEIQDFIRKPHDPSELIQRFGKKPLEFKSGSQFSYSNIGYELLAKVIECITKMPYEEYLNEKLFKPLNLTLTLAPTQGTSFELRKNVSSRLVPEMLYDVTKKSQTVYEPEVRTLTNIGYAQGSGNIISTAQDLLKWNNALHKEQAVLPKELYELLIKPNLNEHGYGIWNRNGVIYYSGKLGAYTSMVLYILEHQASIIMLCNTDFDEPKLYYKTQELDAKLALEILDKDERSKAVNNILMTEYPASRGSAQIMKFLFESVIQN